MTVYITKKKDLAMENLNVETTLKLQQVIGGYIIEHTRYQVIIDKLTEENRQLKEQLEAEKNKRKK